MASSLTKSVEDYLEAIYILSLSHKSAVSVDIASMLEVSKAAVSQAMEQLHLEGYINKEPYGDISLTRKGLLIAKKVYHRHTTIKEFLLDLGISKETAEHDCCLLEHVLSEESFSKIEEAVEKKAK